MRIQLALNVTDLEASIAFYSAMFGDARSRFTDAGMATFEENDTTCCYALQDKVWVHDPAGAPWEVYTVKDDNPTDGRPASASLPLLTCC